MNSYITPRLGDVHICSAIVLLSLIESFLTTGFSVPSDRYASQDDSRCGSRALPQRRFRGCVVTATLSLLCFLACLHASRDDGSLETDTASGDKGVVYTWGRNSGGQLGTASKTSSKVVQAVQWTTCPTPNRCSA